MKKLTDMKIGVRLGAGFGVVLLLMAVLGFLLKFISDQCIAALSNLTAVENKR